MSTNHTENYNLSQWEGSDSFSRLDFNSDNAIIDSALHGISKQIAYTGIRSAKASANIKTLALDVSDIDFTKFLFVELTLDISSTCTSGVASHTLCLNGISTANSYLVSKYYGDEVTRSSSLINTSVNGKYCLSKTLRFSPIETTGKISCIFPFYHGTNDFGICMASIPTLGWSELTSFNYESSSNSALIDAGSGLYLTGVRKF